MQSHCKHNLSLLVYIDKPISRHTYIFDFVWQAFRVQYWNCLQIQSVSCVVV